MFLGDPNVLGFRSNFSTEQALPPLSTFPSLTDHRLNTSISLSIEKSGLSICPITFHLKAECHRLWSFLDDNVDEDDELFFNTFEMCSWTYGEYKKAIKSKALVEGDDFKERYYYAGGSFSLMKWNIGKVKLTLNCHLSKVQNFSTLLSGHVGYAGESSVNSLMAVFLECTESVSTFLSEYVTKQLTISELEVLMMLEKSNKLKVWNENHLREEWLRDKGQNLFPNKWNKATFDALYFIQSRTKKILRVLHVTNAQTHSCKLEYLIPKDFTNVRLPVVADCSGYRGLIIQMDTEEITMMKIRQEREVQTEKGKGTVLLAYSR
eukprot:gene443-794_t